METVFVSILLYFFSKFIVTINYFSIDSDYNLSCSDFHICFRTNSFDAHIIKLSCPSGLFYDIALRVCNFAELVDCNTGKSNNIMIKLNFFNIYLI